MFLVLILTEFQLAAEEQAIAKLSITGQATIKKPADELRISLGVITEGKDAESAMQHNAEKMHAVINALQQLGLTHQEYETGRYAITAIYSRPPKEHAIDWKASIINYEVNNTIQIKTDKLKLAGALIDTAGKSGVNSINQISFGFKDPRSYREEAISAAAENAFIDANTLARAAGVRLVRVIEISLDRESTNIPYYKLAETPIQGGDIEVNARVNLVYEIDGTQKLK